MNQDMLGPERPFPGLRAYAAADHEWFFGREQQNLAIYRLVDRGRFVAVVGSSGSGKSSVVRAGLAPLLEEETAGEGGRRWRWWEMRPGDAPIAQLAHVLAGSVGASADDNVRGIHGARRARIEFLLRKSSFGLRDAIHEARLAPDTTPLLIVDQFEELFRFADLPGDAIARATRREEAAAFVQLLLEATRSSTSQVRVVLTMRSDYLGDCSRFHGLPEAVTACEYLVPALTRDQRAQVIRGPIEKAGAGIADDLVERLLNDSSDELDQLPVLQHALMRTWNHAGSSHPRRLTLENYEAIGRVSNAISLHADDLLASPDLRGLTHVAEQVFRSLSELDRHGRGIRRPLPFAQIVAESGYPENDVRKVIDRFRRDDCCFLVPLFRNGRPLADCDIVDVGHEALIRRWTKMTRDAGAVRAGWLIDEVNDGRTYVALLETARGAIPGQPASLPLDQVEARSAWWTNRPHTSAWTERYGGDIDSVQTLFANSVTALEASRLEQKTRQDVQNKLEREQAKGKRVWRLVLVVLSAMSVMAVLLAGLLIQAAEARKQTAEARRQTAIAEQARQDLAKQKSGAEANAEKARGLATLAQQKEAVAEQQKKFADDQKALAEKKSRDAKNSENRAWAAMRKVHSGQVAARSSETRPVDPERSLLLAVEATRIEATPESVTALRQALKESHIRHTITAGDEIHSVAYSPDGTLLAVASGDHKVRIADAATGRVKSTLEGHAGAVHLVTFSPDGRLVATEAGDETGKVWDVASGKALFTLKGLTGTYAAIAFSPDSTRIAAESGEREASVWAIQSGEKMYSVSHKGAIRMVHFSPDGKLLVTASNDKPASVWRADDGAAVASLPGHTNEVVATAFNTKGTHLVTASLDRTARIYAVGRWDKPVATIEHRGPIHDMRANDSRIVTASEDGTARISDFQGNTLRVMDRHTGPVTYAVFTRDGKFVVTASVGSHNRSAPQDRGDRGDNIARVWDVRSGDLVAQLRGHSGRINSVAVDATGRRVATGSRDRTARIWAMGDQQGLHLGAVATHESATPRFSPDGKLVILPAPGNAAAVMDAITGKKLGQLRGHAEGVRRVALAPDGKAYTADTSGLVRIWDWTNEKVLSEVSVASADLDFGRDGRMFVTASTGKDRAVRVWNHNRVVATLQPPNKASIANAVLSPEGKSVAVVFQEGELMLWDHATGRTLQLSGHKRDVYSAVFNREGSLLVTASADRTARVWDVASGKLLGELTGHADEVNRAVFSPKGDFIVTTSDDNAARIWTWPGRKSRTLQGHSGPVFDADFSADGRFLLTTGEDRSVRVWDVATGNAIDEFKNQVRPGVRFESAVFSPNSNRVMIVSRENGVSVYPCELCGSLDELTKLAAARVSRQLTPDERERYLQLPFSQ